MTIKECYESMEADYTDVARRLLSDERIARFLRMFQRDESFRLLQNALAAGEYQAAFRAAHSLKGICMNLSLTKLAGSAAQLTEALRGGDMGPEVTRLFETTERDYQGAIRYIGQCVTD